MIYNILSILVEVMACRLTAPSHYLNQCRLIISNDLWHSPEGNFTGNPQDNYRKTSNISRTLVGNKIVDNSDVVAALPVCAAPTTSSFLVSMDWVKTTAFKFWDLVWLIQEVLRYPWYEFGNHWFKITVTSLRGWRFKELINKHVSMFVPNNSACKAASTYTESTE